ncbi:MAG: pyridoxal-phosphate-dependent aminotransferase family protein [Longimicrobiales bacterium]
MQPYGRFFLPGPTEVRPEVLGALLRPMIGHRVPAMEALMGRIQPKLKQVFRTERPVYIAPASGTGMMEAAVRNCARRRVLSLTCGAFSERFRRIAEANGLEVEAVEVPWGEVNTPASLADALVAGDYDAVTVCHSETSTGALNPIAELARVCHEHGDVALLVDSVSGLAGAPLLTDEWRLDFVLTGAQKALALPPGLAFGVASEAMLERAEAKSNRGIYFDFLEFEKNIRNNQTPNTPAVSLLYALEVQLEAMAEEGMEARWRRHADMAAATWRWVETVRGDGTALEILAPDGCRSPTVTCIRVPEPWTGPAVVKAAAEKGFALATGYGKLKESCFRIGHMGDHTLDELNALLDALSEVFAS